MIINQIKMGFIILSAEASTARVKSTYNSIINNLDCSSVICVVPKKTKKESIVELEKTCPVFKGKDTFTSLINSGYSNGIEDWNTTLIEGVVARKSIQKLYSSFCKSDKEILFSVNFIKDLLGKPIKIFDNFYDCSLNGIMIHKKAFKEIGLFEEYDSLEKSKLLWAANAIDKGYRFKGIVGCHMS